MTQQSQGGAVAADGASAPVSEDIVTTSEDRSFPRRAASAVKSIASKLLTLELCVLVVLAAVVFGPRLFGIQTYGILTGSMEPAIHLSRRLHHPHLPVQHQGRCELPDRQGRVR